MKTEALAWSFSGEGYGQVLTLEKQGARLFESVADDLVTSAAGGIVLRFNYGRNREYPHELRRLGSKFLMVPRFTDLSDEYYSLASAAGRVIDQGQLLKLWESLRYPVEELDEIAAATSEEVIACWLLNSRVTTLHFTDLSEYQRQVESSVAAVDPNNFKKEELFSRVRNGKINAAPVSSVSGQDVVMFVGQGDRVFEWLSVSVEADCVNLILDGETLVRVEDPNI